LAQIDAASGVTARCDRHGRTHKEAVESRKAAAEELPS